MFGGNSNWRGPVWFPMNIVIVRALTQMHRYYGERLQGRVSDRIRARAQPAGDRHRDQRPPGENVHQRRERPAARVRRDREVPDDPHWHDCCCSTSTSTATTAPASAPAIRPAGPAPSRCCCWPQSELHAGSATTSPGSPSEDRDLRSRAPARPTDRLRDQHGRLAGAARPRPRPRRCRLGEVTGRRVGRAGRAAGRRRVADGRLAAKPRRAAHRDREPRARRRQRAVLPDCAMRT